MDIGLSLTYITRDQDWIKKVLIGGLLALIPIVGFLILYGYGVRIARNVISGVPNPLPEWDDIGGDLSRGFLVFVGGIIWGIPVYALSFCSTLLAGGSDETSILSLFINICLVFPLSILLGVFITPTIIGRFAMTDDFKSMLQFNEVLATIRGIGIGPYLMYFVLAVIAGFIGALGLIACIIGVIFTAAYAIFAISHGVGQLARLAPQAGVTAATDHPAF